MTVQKSFSVFITVVILSIAGVLFWSIDASTFELLENSEPRLLLYAVGLVVLCWIFDSFKFIALARAGGEKLSFKSTLAVVWINYFGCAITPMQSGGGPFQIYRLYKEGISVGKSIAITLVRTIQTVLLLALVIPFSFIADPELLQNYVGMRWYVGYVILFIAVCTLLLLISVLRPQKMKHLVNLVLVWGKRIGILKSKYLMNAVRRASREIDAYNNGIKLFASTGKPWLLVSLIFAVLHLIAWVSVMPCLVMAAGFEINYLQCILAESLLLFMLYFAPTPGASGAAEGGAAAVFSLFVPWNVAGVLAVVWRVLTEYTGTALGTFIVIRTLGWGGANELVNAAKDAASENTGESDNESQ